MKSHTHPARLQGAIVAITTLVATLFALTGGHAAWAQEFQKFEGKPAQAIVATPFVAGAYGFIWASVLIYVLLLARGVGRARAEISELKKKIAGGPQP